MGSRGCLFGAAILASKSFMNEMSLHDMAMNDSTNQKNLKMKRMRCKRDAKSRDELGPRILQATHPSMYSGSRKTSSSRSITRADTQRR
jgi:hypothetical protein